MSLVGEWKYLSVCPLHGPDSIPDHGEVGEVLQGIFPWLITRTRTHTLGEEIDVITSPLIGYGEYEAIQLLLPSGPP